MDFLTYTFYNNLLNTFNTVAVSQKIEDLLIYATVVIYECELFLKLMCDQLIELPWIAFK